MKNKNILITGGAGFIGSHLVKRLVNLGARVTVIVKYKSLIDCVRLTSIWDRINVVEADLRNLDSVIYIKSIKNKFDIIFHLAASAYVPYSFEHPLEVNEVNVVGTLNILEAARQIKGVKRIICTSSSEVYGTALTKKINENHPLNPTSPYAASKAAADRYCFSYIRTYNLPIVIIRPFNTYGPRHTYDVIPKFIKMAINNDNITIHGDGKQSRDLTYISDAVTAFLLVAEKKQCLKKVINFGTGKDYTINFLAKEIKKISQSKSKIVYISKRKSEVQRLTCDARFCMSLGWKHKIDINNGLKLNIEWALRNWKKK